MTNPSLEHFDNFKRLKDVLELGRGTFERVNQIAATRLMPDRGVVKWLARPKQGVLKTTIVLLLLSSAGKIALSIAGEGHVDRQFLTFALSPGAIYVVEALLVVLITVYIVGKGSKDAGRTRNEILQRGVRAENQFFRYWPLLWFSWFVLYLILGFNSLHPIQSPFLSVLLNFVNNLSGLFIFAMFYVLTERTTRGPGDGQLWLPILMVLAVLAGAESLCYVRQFPSTTSAEAIAQWNASVAYLFQLLSGMLVGTLTGLFVARLTSRLFNLPLSALAVLTLFAVIQPVFPVLTAEGNRLNDGIAYVAAFIALYAKVIMLLAIEWLRDRQGILYYMVNAARLFDDERERRMGESFQVMVESLFEMDDDNGEGTPPDIRPTVSNPASL